jgi:predicted PurR-regulated permease PerM
MKQPKSLLQWAILLVATVLVAYLCWLILLPFLGVIAWSVVLVITFYPVQQRLVRYTGRASLSALLSSLLVVLTILIPVLLVTGLVINEFLALRDTLQSQFSNGFDLNQIAFLRQTLDWLHQHGHLDPARMVDWIRQNASNLARWVARYSFTFAGNVSSLLVSFCFTLFTTFLLFRDGERMAMKIPDLLPLERSQSEGLLRRVRDVIDGSIYGVLVIALIQGGLGGLTFWVLGIPSPVLWGLVMAVAKSAHSGIGHSRHR